MTTNSPNPVDGDVLKELRSRYAEPKIPSCSICGGELSVQRSGGGSPTIWACSGMIDDPTGERTWIYAEGRSCADEHYERSRWTDYRRGGDSDVIDLIDAYQALLALHLNATAQPVSDGLVSVPRSLTAENGAKAALLGEFSVQQNIVCHECLGEGCDDCNGQGHWISSIPVDWTTIKEIWAKGVEHFSPAAPGGQDG
ncbi:hypothetical protein [Pantoea sp. SGAir0215]